MVPGTVAIERERTSVDFVLRVLHLIFAVDASYLRTCTYPGTEYPMGQWVTKRKSVDQCHKTEARKVQAMVTVFPIEKY
jgi:hypothetical protein